MEVVAPPMGTGEQGEDHEHLRDIEPHSHEHLREIEPHGNGEGEDSTAHEESTTDLSMSMDLNGGAPMNPSLPSVHTVSTPYLLHHPLVMIAPPHHSPTHSSDAMESYIPPEILQQLRQEFAEERAQLKRQLDTLRQEILDNYDKRQRTCMEEDGDMEEGEDGDEEQPGGMGKKERRNNEERYLNVPVYMLSSEVKTVRDLWTEYTVGWKGGPAVKDLNDRFGSRWRRTTVARQHWCRRESVIREIKNRTRLAYQHKRRAAGLADGAEWAPGSQEESAPMDYMVAVMDLEKYMSENNLTLNQLARQLKRASVAAHAAHAQAHAQIHAHVMAQAMALEYPHGHMPQQQEGGVEGELQPMQLSDHTEPHHHHHDDQQQPQDGMEHHHHGGMELHHRHHSLHDGQLDQVEEEGDHAHHLHPPYDPPHPPPQHESMISII